MKEPTLRAVVHSRIMAKKREAASAKRLAAEDGIASDESAVAGLEIEANKGPVEEPEKGPAESAAAKGDGGEAGCPIPMGDLDDPAAHRCRRKFHIAPDGVDSTPVCLMHSMDPNKQSGRLFEVFRQEFEKILIEAGENVAHFEGFIFPKIDFKKRIFQAICRFNFSTFTQNADFREATFSQDTDFRGATFTRNAHFFRATFTRDADFSSTTFTRNALYSYATFSRNALFSYATFSQDAGFSDVTFSQDADFSEAIFKRDVFFFGATFKQDANFSRTTFGKDAEFNSATFAQNADFNSVTFTENANFIGALFMKSTYFSGATFTKTAKFWHSEFHGTAWQGCRFLDRAEFRNTQFEPQVEGEPSAVFALAKFSKPGEIVFEDVDLSRALFRNCDVSQVWFTSSVRWGKRQDRRRLVVFEEKVLLEEKFVDVLRRYGPLDYPAVAQIYQQLKKNYDSRLDYWTANEFHFGEMEMKRLAGPTNGPLLWLRQWWHRNLSFVALYRWASDYGNSYRMPLLWLLGTLLAAALLFPIPGVGLKQPISGDAASSASVTYIRVWNRQDSWTNNFWTEAKLIGKSGITAIDTATFQRTPEYTPVYPRGRVLAIVEMLLTSSLFALFLLAIRRQFRR